MLKFGSRGHDLVAGPTTPEALGAAAQKQGIHRIQLALGMSFPAWSSADVVGDEVGCDIRAGLAAHDVEVAVMGCYFNMIHPDVHQRELGCERFEAYLKHAASFGCGVVASETGSVDTSFAYTEDNFCDGPFEAAVETIGRLVRAAERAGVSVGIEPGVNHPIHDVDTCKRLFERVDSPNLKLILDETALVTPTLAPVQLDIFDDMLTRFAGCVAAVHLVDYRIEEGALVRCNLGEGQLDIDGVLSRVRTACPDVPVITEFTEGDAIGRFMAKYGKDC